MKKKNQQKVLQTNDKTSRNQTLQEKSRQRDKHPGSYTCKILRTISKIDKGELRSENKKVDDDAKDDIDYILHKKGGRELVSIEDSVEALIRRLEDYIKKTNYSDLYQH